MTKLSSRKLADGDGAPNEDFFSMSKLAKKMFKKLGTQIRKTIKPKKVSSLIDEISEDDEDISEKSTCERKNCNCEEPEFSLVKINEREEVTLDYCKNCEEGLKSCLRIVSLVNGNSNPLMSIHSFKDLYVSVLVYKIS